MSASERIETPAVRPEQAGRVASASERIETPAVRPVVNRDSAFFWEGTRQGELRVQTCNACGTLRHPPGPACPSCGALDRGYVVASGLGTVYSYVVHRHPPVPGKALPIVIALVDLDEGVRMVGEVVDVPADGEDAIGIGMRLRADFARVDEELTLPVWRRVEERAAEERGKEQ